MRRGLGRQRTERERHFAERGPEGSNSLRSPGRCAAPLIIAECASFATSMHSFARGVPGRCPIRSITSPLLAERDFRRAIILRSAPFYEYFRWPERCSVVARRARSFASGNLAMRKPIVLLKYMEVARWGPWFEERFGET
jgi:hypothetical protein